MQSLANFPRILLIQDLWLLSLSFHPEIENNLVFRDFLVILCGDLCKGQVIYIYIDFFYKPATHVLNYGALHTTTLGQKVFLKQSNTVKVEAFYEVQNFSLDCFNEESFSVVKQYTQFNMDCKSLCTERNFSKFYAKVSVKSWLLFILILKIMI